MLQLYIEFVQRTKAGAFLWKFPLGVLHANARGNELCEDPVIGDTVEAACKRCSESATADIAETPETRMLILPLLGEQGATECVLAVENFELRHVPLLLFQLHSHSRHFSKIIHQLPQVVLTARPNGTFDYASQRWFQTFGGRPQDEVTVAVLATAGELAGRFSERWRDGVAGGRPFSFEIDLESVKGIRCYDVRATPVLESGRLVKWVVTVDDIDDAVRLRDQLAAVRSRLEVLASIGGIALEGSRDIHDVTGRIMEAAASAVGGAWIAWYESGGQRRTIVRPHSERALLAAIDAMPRSPTETSTFSIDDCGFRREAATAPLMLGFLEGSHGVAVVRERGASAFSEPDLNFIREVTWRIGSALATRLRYEREQRIARVLQAAMLPVALPKAPGLQFDVVYRPAESEALVCGDWYDAFELPDGRIAFSIGDVGGHGLEAASAMAHVRELLRVGALQGLSAGDAITRTNAAVHASNRGFVTAILGYIDPLTMEIELANAGHAGPYVVSLDGHAQPVTDGGTMLGVVANERYRTHSLQLEGEVAIVLYTDGLVEARRNIEAGEEQLHEALRVWGQSNFDGGATYVLESVLGDTKPRDDIAILVLRVKSVPLVDATVPANPTAARRARKAISRIASEAPFGDRNADFVLAMSEAVNNAIEHGSRIGDRIRVAVAWDANSLRGSVESPGPWLEPVASEHRGRGIGLMQRLTDDCELQPSES
ncbi:MAG: SpoIIE family protein phosphatase, partial [Candidatus Eremiobacteraeota bacterium]|nr:SpoIIE family protein phosphatase [Candidatus Eremiobacteraeota bacterium]